jgi:post-segregation antitoxin (ccd killing protein)
MGLVSDIGEIEKKVDELEERISGLEPSQEGRKTADVHKRSIGELSDRVQTLDLRTQSMARFIKDLEKYLSRIEKSTKGTFGRSEVRDTQGTIAYGINSMNEYFKNKINGIEAKLAKLASKNTEYEKAVADFEKEKELINKFKERIILISGLVLQSQAKSRALRNTAKKEFESGMAEMRAMLDEFRNFKGGVKASVVEPFPKEEAMGLVSDIGEIEKKVDELEERISGLEPSQEGRVQELYSKTETLARFIKDLEKYLSRIESSTKSSARREEVRETQNTIAESISSLSEYFKNKTNGIEAKLAKLASKNTEYEKTVADFMKEKELINRLKERIILISDLVQQSHSESRAMRNTAKKEFESGMAEMRAMLEDFREIDADSKEKLGMVKELIDNIEKRFRIEMDSLTHKVENIIKMQEKQELETISPDTDGGRRK